MSDTRLNELERKINSLLSKVVDLRGRRIVNVSPSKAKGEYVSREELYQFQDKTSKRIQSLAEETKKRAPLPNPPTSVNLTIVDAGDNRFIIEGEWDAPVPIGGTVGYQWEAIYASDSLGNNLTSEWIPLGTYYLSDFVKGNSGPHPRDIVDTYCKIRVAGYNNDNVLSSWEESAWVLVEAGDYGGNFEPDQPNSGDWSLASIIYRADKNGNQFARVRANITTIPSNADYVEFWLDSGNGYKPIGILTDVGDSDHWEPQPTSSTTWYVKATASKFSYKTLPGDDTKHPPKSLSVAAWQGALQLTGGTCSLQEMTWLNVDGKKRYRLKHTATGPTDPNRQAIRVYRRWTDSGWNPAPGEPGNWGIISGVDATIGTSWTWYTAEIEGFPAPDTVTNYNQITYVPINHAGDENWTSALSFNISFSPDGGFKATAIDPATLGHGILAIGGKLVAGVRNAGLSNGNFDAGLKDWELAPSGHWTIETTDAFEGNALRGKGTGSDKYAYNEHYLEVRPGQILKCTFYARSNLSGGVGFCYLQYYTPSKAGGGLSTSRIVTGDTYTGYTLVDTVPSGAAFVRVVFAIQSVATSGRMLIDNVTLELLEVVGEGITRNVTGTLIIEDGALSNLAKYNSSVRPMGIGSSLPSLPSSNYPVGSFFYNTSNVRLYRNISNVWQGAPAEEIVTGTLGASVIYGGSVNVAQLTAGTATFAGDVTFSRASGASIKIDGTYVLFSHASSSDYLVSMGNSGLHVEKISTSQVSEISFSGISTNGTLTSSNVFMHSGSIVILSSSSSWRTALGLTTFTLYYKDHSGTNQTQTNVVRLS